ncbi:MAG: fumarylacetoacetate hydrolase family protein [Pseudomonadota bacterium]
MDHGSLEAAATFLAAHRDKGIKISAFPDGCTPPDEATAYEVQAALHDLLTRQNLGPRIGWKVGCTTETMQTYLGIDHPCAGGLFKKRVQLNRGAFAARSLCQAGVECEIAVITGPEISAKMGPFDIDKIAGYVDCICVAIELVDNRYEDWSKLGVPGLVADDFFQAGAVLGRPIKDWRNLDLTGLTGKLEVNGKSHGAGVSSDILGHPLRALAWLAHHLTGSGKVMPAGSVVLLGSLVQTAWLEPGDSASISIESLGEVSLSVQ